MTRPLRAVLDTRLFERAQQTLALLRRAAIDRLAPSAREALLIWRDVELFEKAQRDHGVVAVAEHALNSLQRPGDVAARAPRRDRLEELQHVAQTLRLDAMAMARFRIELRELRRVREPLEMLAHTLGDELAQRAIGERFRCAA